MMVTPMLCTGSFDSTEMYSNHTSENDKDLPNSIIHFTSQTSNFIFWKFCTIKTVNFGDSPSFCTSSFIASSMFQMWSETPHQLHKVDAQKFYVSILDVIFLFQISALFRWNIVWSDQKAVSCGRSLFKLYMKHYEFINEKCTEAVTWKMK